MKLRLQPIRVYCLHHVSLTFDEESMNADDWVQIEEFKNKVLHLQQDGVAFISMTEAYQHICDDWIRYREYAVLTFDDGYASLKEILPWLEEHYIPSTLFINGKYLDGKSFRKNPNEQYLAQEELFQLTTPLIEVGLHGWEHTDATKMTENEFNASVMKSQQLLTSHPRYIPFCAYPWGRHNKTIDKQLDKQQLIPVLMDGLMNYNNAHTIHRELLR